MPLYPCALAGINWTSDTIVAILYQSDFVVDLTDAFLSDISGTELSGGGYSRLTLGTKTNDFTLSTNKTVTTAANLEWTGITAADLAYCVIAKSTGVAGTSRLIGVLDLRDTTITPRVKRELTNATINVNWRSAGILDTRYE